VCALGRLGGGFQGACRDVVNLFLIRFSAYFSNRIFAIIENFDPRFDVYPFHLFHLRSWHQQNFRVSKH
jgi:hypothetical protein